MDAETPLNAELIPEYVRRRIELRKQKTDKYKAYKKAYRKTDKYKAYKKAYHAKLMADALAYRKLKGAWVGILAKGKKRRER